MQSPNFRKICKIRNPNGRFRSLEAVSAVALGAYGHISRGNRAGFGPENGSLKRFVDPMPHEGNGNHNNNNNNNKATATSLLATLAFWKVGIFQCFLNLQPLQHYVAMFVFPDKCTREKNVVFMQFASVQ